MTCASGVSPENGQTSLDAEDSGGATLTFEPEAAVAVDVADVVLVGGCCTGVLAGP